MKTILRYYKMFSDINCFNTPKFVIFAKIVERTVLFLYEEEVGRNKPNNKNIFVDLFINGESKEWIAKKYSYLKDSIRDIIERYDRCFRNFLQYEGLSYEIFEEDLKKEYNKQFSYISQKNNIVK